MFKHSPRLSPLALLPLFILLSSCATQQNGRQFTVPAGRQGLVHGGQQPVTGATIQLYAVGTAGDGSAATPLLSPAPVTDANGAFNLSSQYTCPSPSSLVYIVASGGNPGLFPGTNNAALSMMAALGPCSSLSTSTFIFIDELTTVAAVYSLAPFMTSPSSIGSTPADAAALAAAFALASQFVNTPPDIPGHRHPRRNNPCPSNRSIPSATSSPPASTLPAAQQATTHTCGMLFSLTTPTGITPATDTITATLHLANDPTLNTAALYGLVPAFAPFQPCSPRPRPISAFVSLFRRALPHPRPSWTFLQPEPYRFGSGLGHR